MTDSFKYHYELMDLSVFDGFQFTAMILILTLKLPIFGSEPVQAGSFDITLAYQSLFLIIFLSGMTRCSKLILYIS